MSETTTCDSAQAASPTTKPKLYLGWKEIACALRVVTDTAQKYAARNVDPLPVFYDFAERPTVRSDVMADWVDRQMLPYQAFQSLRSRGLHASQGGETATPVAPRRRRRRHGVQKS